ncbi:MAG: beta strand repeat-containing protein [Methylobacter sp.]
MQIKSDSAFCRKLISKFIMEAVMAGFILVSTQTIIARNAGALYGLEVGNSNMTSYVSQVGSSMDAFLNTVYTNSVGTTDTGTVADVLITNLGITGDSTDPTSAAGQAKSYIVGQLNAVAYTARGAVVNNILSMFSNLSTDPTFGTFATNWNNKVSNAVTYAQTSGNADTNFANVSTAVNGQTFTLTTGSDTLIGTANNDTFNATLSSSAQTLNPGDNLDGAAGTGDILNVTSTITGNGSTTTVAGVTLNNIETVAVQNLGSNGTAGQFNTVVLDGTNYTGATSLQANYSTGGVSFTNLKNIVNVSATGNGTATGTGATLSIGYQAAVIAGTNDSATIALNGNGSAKTANNFLDITENGIENLTLTSTGTASFAKITDSALKTLTITGDKALDLSAGTNPFAGSSVDASSASKVQTVNASAFTGDLTIDMSGNAANTYVSITGGSGNDTITVRDIDKNSTIAGGAGTADTIAVTNINSTAGTTDAFTNITGFEKVQLSGALTTALDTTSIGGVTNVVLGAAANNGGSLTNAASGFTLSYLDAAVTGGAQSVTASITNAQSGTADSLNVVLGTTTTAGTGNRDYGTLTTSYVETVNITTNSKVVETATANTLNLNDIGAKTIVVTGNEKLALTLAGMTTVTSISASGANGGLAMASAVGLSTVGASITGSAVDDTIYGGGGNDTISAGSGNDTIVMGTNQLNNSDSIDGGAGTNDVLTATFTTGLTATTGALKIANVENIGLTVSAASTIDATNITGASVIAVNGAATASVTNLAANATVGLGYGGTAETSTATFALANATGTADQLNIKLTTTAAGQAATVVTSGIETVNFSGYTGVALGGTQALNIASVDASTVTVSGTNTTLSGRTIDFSGAAVNVATKTIDASGDTDASGTFKVTANSTATTIKGSAGANSLTGGAGNDTISIASKFNNSDTVAGGGGTDTLNATITESATVTNLSNISAIANINLTIDSSVATVAITNAGGTAGFIDGALKTISVLGASALSSFKVVDTTTGGGVYTKGVGKGGALTSFDASGFSGSTEVLFDKAALASTVTIKGGTGASDIAHFDLAATNNTGKATISGFEQIEVASYNGAGTVDLSNVTGLSRLIVSDDGTARSTTVNGLAAGVAVDLGYGSADLGTSIGATSGTLVASSTVALNLATISGTADAMTVNVNKVGAGAATLNVDGVESLTMNFASGTATSWTIGESTNTNAQTLTLASSESANNVTLTTLPSLMTTINASGLADNLIMASATGRSGNAMTITTGSGNDTIFMTNKSDVIDAGTGTNTLKITQLGTVGGFQVDLSSTTDQVTQYNGVSNAAAQKGFVNVDLSGVTGSFGADVTASSKGSIITGTSNADTITLGVGKDYVNISSTSGSDTINSFTAGASKDVLDISFSLKANDGTVVNLAGTNGTNDVAANNFIALDNKVIASATGYSAATNTILVINTSVATISADTTAAFRTAFGTASGTALTAAANDRGHFLVVAYDGTGTTANAVVYDVDLSTSTDTSAKIEAGDTVNLVGILTGVGANTLVAGNFL